MLKLLFIILFVCSLAHAQNTPFELGIDVTGTHLHKIDEAPVGAGARFLFNFTNAIALDTELIRYPGKTSGLFGMKVGPRFGRFGVTSKTRFGFWHFTQTYFAADVGGVVEYHASPHITVRIDAGDSIIYYGGTRLGTVHNFQPGIGFSYRF